MIKYILLVSLIVTSAASAQQKIDVQAHRGGRALMPENTIPAMIHAIDLGVRTLELDCVISSDNKVVVSHDVYMSSGFMRTPDSKDIDKKNEKSYAIYKMTYDSVRKYDAGTKPHAEFPDQKKIKTYRPLLSELIDSVEAYVKLHHLKPVYYNMETKCSPEGDGVFHPKPDVFSALVMEVINKKHIAERVIIQSFDIRTLQIIHKDFPKQKTALLIYNEEGLDANIKTLGFTPDIYSPYFAVVTPELVKEAHGKKVAVLPWTVNEVRDMEKMISYGVDGIITDCPDKLVAVAGSYQKK
ncbi:glycerophosphodiester phosphodiesterase family protein [Chitinophaga sp. CF118]|uniref:glycerophosphodiester phosphodiesterase family protein n=1 Tax=Chitinophaga sp. CF118 TaxID=1884367 RepID=UPI000B7FA921|nr:glycerophosphodiester phosphodiesterase family protein [Chitinophaga sp. CF118]